MNKNNFTNTQPTKYITQGEAPARYRMSKATIRRIADEAGATIKISSRLVRYDVERLDNYLETLRKGGQQA